MTLGIRGANPIWLLDDLAGNLFDDTFWMYVLENTIPYVPKPVYHDPDLNIAWDNPIQFLGNGTLPNNIYFLPGEVYRLEFRQSDGLSAPSQQDPLIYLVENYMAGEGGGMPVDTIALTSSNQLTNPQFALFNIQNPTTFSDTNPDPYEIAPGWTLEASGTGSVIVSQVALNSDTQTDSNAPYALRLQLSGWTADSVVLKQKFEQSGVLWANKIVSTAITARVERDIITISAALYDSQNAPIADLLTTPVGTLFEEFTDYAELKASTDTDNPPDAYIEYRLFLPSNCDVFVTSIQLVVQDLPVEPSFEQDSINRQIDHSYNTAYPIVPIGTVIDFAGFVIPDHYYLCDGASKNRIRDYALFNALTITETVTLTSASATFTVVSNTNYHIGMALEGTGIAASTTISTIVGTTITMSAVATATGPSSVRFFAWGAGNGSTTFNVPNLQGYATAGANGIALGSNVVNGVGLRGGEATHAITIAEMPSHNHPGTTLQVGNNTGSGVHPRAVDLGFTNQPIVTIAPQGGGTLNVSGSPMSLAQLTAMMKKCIRYE